MVLKEKKKHFEGQGTEGRDNTEMDLREAERKGAKSGDLATDTGKWRAPENMVMKRCMGPSVNW
jgi:hypothetical protein